MLSRSIYLKGKTGALASFAGLICSWQVISGFGGSMKIFLPEPLEVLTALTQLLREEAFYKAVAISVWRVFVAFVLSMMLAVPIGLMAGRYAWVHFFIAPINDFLRFVPVPALVPLCILLFGIGEVNKVALIFVGTVFQVIPLISDSAFRVPSELIDAARIHGADETVLIRKVVWPWCQPTVFEVGRVSFGWAWSYLVLAEVVGGSSGLGHIIVTAQRFLKMDRVVAGVIIIGLLGLSSDTVFRRLRPRFIPWQSSAL
jgi:NitT/TauT family transport system permease protein